MHVGRPPLRSYLTAGMGATRRGIACTRSERIHNATFWRWGLAKLTLKQPKSTANHVFLHPDCVTTITVYFFYIIAHPDLDKWYLLMIINNAPTCCCIYYFIGGVRVQFTKYLISCTLPTNPDYETLRKSELDWNQKLFRNCATYR